MTRINYTGRRRIPRDRVQLRVRTVSGIPHLDVLRLDLSGMPLPDSATLVVEAYRRSKFTRFPSGTVGSPDLPSGQTLNDFEAAESPLFRVKVVGADGDAGKLLAVADQLRPQEEDEGPQTSLLSIAGAPLGQQLWKLDLNDDDPQLVVNSGVGDWKNFASSPLFTALVLPEALRQVIDWAVRDLADAGEEEETPRALWVSFLADELGQDPRGLDLAEPDDLETFVSDAVRRFCNQHRFLDLVIDELNGEEP